MKVLNQAYLQQKFNKNFWLDIKFILQKTRLPIVNKSLEIVYLETIFRICPPLCSLPIKDSKRRGNLQKTKHDKCSARPPSLKMAYNAMRTVERIHWPAVVASWTPSCFFAWKDFGLFEGMACGVKDIEFKDLDVEEVEITSAVLTGGAHHLGQYCDKDFKNFMGCRYGYKDPRKCLDEGKQATKCALEFFKKLKDECNDVFTKHWTCLDYNNQEFAYCRATQKKFDACVLEKLGLECTQPVHIELSD